MEAHELFTISVEPCNYRSILNCADEWDFLNEAKEQIRNATDKNDAFYEVLDRCKDYYKQSILDIKETRIITVLEATGGPAYGYDFEVDEKGEVIRARHWTQDWYEPKKYDFTLTDDEADDMAIGLGLTEFYY